jgi:hypothetical protein
MWLSFLFTFHIWGLSLFLFYKLLFIKKEKRKRSTDKPPSKLLLNFSDFQTTSQTSQQLHHPLGHYPFYPKMKKNRNHQISSHFKVERKKINGFPVLLTQQNQSITMMHIFLKSSIVRIFPKFVVYTKSVTLKGALFLQILFQEKGEAAGD